MIVHCSSGSADVLPGMRWRDGLTGTEWEVVEPTNTTIYSPSGFCGTPCFWCLPVGDADKIPARWLDEVRADGCVSFCGDSIAASILTGRPKEQPHG